MTLEQLNDIIALGAITVADAAKICNKKNEMTERTETIEYSNDTHITKVINDDDNRVKYPPYTHGKNNQPHEVAEGALNDAIKDCTALVDREESL